MKKFCIYLLFVVLGLIITSGCSIVDKSSSSVSRTIGLGEEALPIQKHNLGIEISIKKIRMLDKIYMTEYTVNDQAETEIDISGNNENSSNLYSDYTVRFGLTDIDEISLGFLRGSEGSTSKYSHTSDGVTTTKEFECRTKYTGIKLAYKRLLSQPENPMRLSVFMSVAKIIFDSTGDAARFDAESLETRAAILVGLNDDLMDRKSYPTLAIYHSSAHTERNETIPGIPKQRSPQSIGAELLYNIDFGYLYTAISGGAEQQIAGDIEDDSLIYQMGFKIGLKLGKK